MNISMQTGLKPCPGAFRGRAMKQATVSRGAFKGRLPAAQFSLTSGLDTMSTTHRRQGKRSLVVSNAGSPASRGLLVFCPRHPLIAHWLAVCRNKLSPPPVFRSAVAEIGRILIYEASQEWLPTAEGQVETPLGIADCRYIDPSQPVKVIPILRAGLILLEQAATVLPASETYHVGYVRDESTLQPTMYLNKLPARFAPDDRIIITDPMIATGGTIRALLAELMERGAAQEMIRIISVVVAPPALEAISVEYSGVRIFAGMIDESLNDQGFIVPGLGDAGDRAFGT